MILFRFVGAVWMTCHSIKMSTIKFRTMKICYACISREVKRSKSFCVRLYEPDHMRLRKSIYNDYSLSRKLKFSDCVRLRNTFKTIYKVYTFFDFVNKIHYKSIIWADDQAHCGLDGHTPLQLQHYGLPKNLAQFICNCKIWIHCPISYWNNFFNKQAIVISIW